MKKILISFLTLSFLVTTVRANPYAALDVFEEYALTEADLICDDLVLTTVKNTKIKGKLPFTSSKDPVTVEIVSRPKNGKLTLKDTKGNFIYTPDKDFTGTDTFQFRVSIGTQNSNISSCLITVGENEIDAYDKLDFFYTDMEGHWANDAVLNLMALDIIKGERVGKDYFFYPDTKMRRIDAIFYILSAKDVDLSKEESSNTRIFADSDMFPQYINSAGYIAKELGFLQGTKKGELTFLNPYEYITRAELICMIDLATGEKKVGSKKLSFKDKDTIPQWAYNSVRNLKALGVITGYEDNSLRPYDNVTKAEVSQLIYEIIKYNEENATKTISKRIKNAIYGNINV